MEIVMARAVDAPSGHELHAIQNETQTDVVRFRLTPSLKRHIEESLAELSVTDFSAFARGAILNAIELARLAKDPKWKEFIATVKGPARHILGHGLTLSTAQDTENLGRERKGLTAKEMKEKMAKRSKSGTATV
jgi:hypothetical protein